MMLFLKDKFQLKDSINLDGLKDKDLISSFVDNGVVDKLLSSSESSIVIGPKGAGKSAILQYIEKKRKDSQNFFSLVSFKDVSNAESIKRFVELAKGPFENAKYTNLFAYIIQIELLRLIWENQSTEAKFREEIESFFKNNNLDIKEKSEPFFGWKLSEIVFKIPEVAEVKLAKERDVKKVHFQDLPRALIPLIKKYTKGTDAKYYILFDELDEEYSEKIRAGDNFSKILTGLFDVANKINSENSNFRIIIALRSDIYSQLTSANADKWPNPRKINWNQDKLQEFVIRRFEGGDSLLLESSIPVVWSKIFNWSSWFKGKDNYFTLLLNKTRYRPRDLLQLILELWSEEEKCKNGPCDYQSFTNAIKRYSEWFLKSVKSEVFQEIQEIDEIFAIIKNLGKRDFTANEVPNISHENLIKLGDFGVLGYRVPFTDKSVFCYSDNGFDLQPKNQSLIVHPGLWYALKLESSL